MVKKSFSEPKNQRKLKISRPVYLKKKFAHRIAVLISTNKLEGLSLGKIFSQRLTRLIWASFFSTKK